MGIWDNVSQDNGWKNRCAIFTPELFVGGQRRGRWRMTTNEAEIAAAKARSPEHVMAVLTVAELETELRKKYPALPGFSFIHPEHEGFLLLSTPLVTTQKIEELKAGCKEYKQSFRVPYQAPPMHVPPELLWQQRYALDEEFVYDHGIMRYAPDEAKQLKATYKAHEEKIYREGLVPEDRLKDLRTYLAKQITNHFTRFSGATLKEARCKFTCTFANRYKKDFWADIEELLRWVEICQVDFEPKQIIKHLADFEPFLPGLLKRAEENRRAIAKWIGWALKEGRKPEKKARKKPEKKEKSKVEAAEKVKKPRAPRKKKVQENPVEQKAEAPKVEAAKEAPVKVESVKADAPIKVEQVKVEAPKLDVNVVQVAPTMCDLTKFLIEGLRDVPPIKKVENAPKPVEVAAPKPAESVKVEPVKPLDNADRSGLVGPLANAMIPAVPAVPNAQILIADSPYGFSEVFKAAQNDLINWHLRLDPIAAFPGLMAVKPADVANNAANAAPPNPQPNPPPPAI